MVRGERLSMLSSRRGMSPLIATILLMAFAVALGGMIMNWSSDIVIANDDCEEMDIRVTKFCSQDNKILLNARNMKGGAPLSGVKLLVQSENIENLVNVGNSELPTGGQISLAIPFVTDGSTTVELLGVIGVADSQYVCEATPIERVSPIQPC